MAQSQRTARQSLQNLAVLRHIVLNLLKQGRTTQLGIKNKRLKAGWDETYLRTLLIQLVQIPEKDAIALAIIREYSLLVKTGHQALKNEQM